MAAEIELKLTLPMHRISTLRDHPLLAQYQLTAPTLNHLYNCYFDTPDQVLNRHAVALRIRRKGDLFIQTLKTRGISQGGLHQRQEWEWVLPDNQLDFSLLPRDALPAEIDLGSLRPAFYTNFERTTWNLSYGEGDARAEIELVLDLGAVSTESGQTDPIREIELELKSGPAESLIAFAIRLAESLPLRTCRISKAERGYRLDRPERARRLPPRPAEIDAAPQRACYALIDTTAERLLSAMEGYEFLHEPALLLQLHQQLQLLEQLLRAYADAVGAQTLADQFSHSRHALEAQITPLLLAAATGLEALPGLPAVDPAAIQAWLESPELGQALLALSALQYHRPWQSAR